MSKKSKLLSKERVAQWWEKQRLIEPYSRFLQKLNTGLKNEEAKERNARNQRDSKKK